VAVSMNTKVEVTYSNFFELSAGSRPNPGATLLPYSALESHMRAYHIDVKPAALWFQHMTPLLRQAISDVITGLERVPTELPTIVSPSKCESISIDDAMPTFKDSSFPCCFLVLPYSSDETGLVATNQRYSDVFDMHREELYARVAAGEKPHLWTEIRGFILIIMSMIAIKFPGLKLIEQYHRAHRLHGGTVHFQRICTRLKFRESAVHLSSNIVQLSEDEYLAALSQNSTTCDTLGLPFLNHVPDFDTERFEHLNATAEGRQRLDALATRIYELFNSAAKNVTNAVELPGTST